MDVLAQLIVLWTIGLVAGRAIMLAIDEYYNPWWRIAIGIVLFIVSVAAFLLGGLVGMGFVEI